jgi:hypothetical protein
MPTIFEEIQSVLKLKPQAGETPDEFALRVCKDKINKMKTEAWNGLSEELQNFSNDVLKINEERITLRGTLVKDKTKDKGLAEVEAAVQHPFPVLEGFEGLPAPDTAEAEAEGEEEERVEEPAPKATAPKKAAPKKIPPKKVAAPPKKTTAAKTPKAAAKEEKTRGRAPAFSDEGVIKLVKKENPHRNKGSIRYKAFEKLSDNMTVAAAIKAGCPRQQLWSMWSRGVISVKG